MHLPHTVHLLIHEDTVVLLPSGSHLHPMLRRVQQAGRIVPLNPKQVPPETRGVRTCGRRYVRTPWRLSSHSSKRRGLTTAIAACPSPGVFTYRLTQVRTRMFREVPILCRIDFDPEIHTGCCTLTLQVMTRFSSERQIVYL